MNKYEEIELRLRSLAKENSEYTELLNILGYKKRLTRCDNENAKQNNQNSL